MLIFASGFDLCEEINLFDRNETLESVYFEQEKQPERDICTPFCHCGRCAFSIILPEKLKENCIYTLPKGNRSAVTDLVLLQISPSIWQPPKLSQH